MKTIALIAHDQKKEEMLEFDWILLEFRKQFNRKIKERGINYDL